jgi:hypothetical protein
MQTPPGVLAAVVAHSARRPFRWRNTDGKAGSPTSHSALPAPLPFFVFLWGLRPVCLAKGTGVRSSRNTTFVQLCLRL